MNIIRSEKMLNSNINTNNQVKNISNSQIIKFILIILVILALDVLLHQLVRLIYDDPNFPAEVARRKIPYIILIMTGFFASIGLGFLIIKDYLPGTPLKKGMLYGLLNSFIYFIAFLELPILFNHDLFITILSSLADIIPIFILGIVLGLTFSKNNITYVISYFKLKFVVIIIIFSFVFTLGRYFTFLIGEIINTKAFIGAYQTKSLETFLWTAMFGLSVGFLYFFIEPVIKQEFWSLNKILLVFGTFIFGLHWILYTLFFPIIMDESFFVLDTLIRSLCDCIYFLVGIIIVQILDKKL